MDNNGAPITPEQSKYIEQLVQELQQLEGSRRFDLTSLADTSGFTLHEARERIALLKQARDSLYAKKGRQVLKKITPGFYRREGKTYQVRPSKRGTNMYALRVTYKDGKPSGMSYERGAIYELRPLDRMSQEEFTSFANEFGNATGKCVICQRKITVQAHTGICPGCRTAI